MTCYSIGDLHDQESASTVVSCDVTNGLCLAVPRRATSGGIATWRVSSGPTSPTPDVRSATTITTQVRGGPPAEAETTTVGVAGTDLHPTEAMTPTEQGALHGRQAATTATEPEHPDLKEGATRADHQIGRMNIRG